MLNSSEGKLSVRFPIDGPPGPRHRVVIIGGGFGGLRTAQYLKGAPVEVLLIDRRNFHLFQPLLYQVATGGLSPANIAAPLRAVLKNQKNTEVLLGDVTDIDTAQRTIHLDGHRIGYNTLVLATGSRHHYFGHDEWEKLAPGLKTIEDATEIRKRVLQAVEAAELESDPEKIEEDLTFVIIGGGPTGVELAGALCEIAHHTLKGNYRRINPADARIILVEFDDRVLPPYPKNLSKSAGEALQKLGATLKLKCKVVDIRPGAVTLESAGKSEIIRARTVLWAAGVMASPAGKIIAKSAGVETDKAGRVPVNPDLTIPNHPEIFVIGDLAALKGPDGKLLPDRQRISSVT